MMYSTSTSRRVVKVKVKKARTQQRNMWTPPPTITGPTQNTVPPLFDRVSPYQRKIKQSPPWYTTWKAIIPVFFLVPVAALAYAIATPSETEKPVQRSAPQEYSYAGGRQSARSANGVEVIQLRPMGYGGASGHGASGSSGSFSQGALPSSGGSTPRKETLAAASVSEEEAVLASMEQNRKVVLPENVSGNCSIAHAGLKDLSSCVARNGGRAQ